jgi:hypothetical protein
LKHNSALQVHRAEKYLYPKSFNSVFPCNYHSTGASYLSSFSGDKWMRRGGHISRVICCQRQCYVVRGWYMIYLLTAVGLSPGGSTHLHTDNTQNNTNNNRTTQITTNVEECGPCPVIASYILAFALQLREKSTEKPSVRVRKPSFSLRKSSVRVKWENVLLALSLVNPRYNVEWRLKF